MIFLNRPHFGEEEIEEIRKTLASGWVAGQGPKNSELAENLKLFTKTRYTIPVSSCTAGLHLSLLAVGVKPGDEVLVSDYTFPASAHAVMYCGAKPRFVDVRLETYNLDPEQIEEKITSKTSAIVVVHAFGQPADMDPIMKIAATYRLKVIEDAACALGAGYKNRPAGSMGDIAAISFHGRKNITCGEGGAVLTNNRKYADCVRSLSCFGIKPAYQRQRKFAIPSFRSLGYNYKLSDINAAIVLAQLKRYPSLLRHRLELVKIYDTLLKECPYLAVPFRPKETFHVYQTYAVVLKPAINRNRLILSLRKEGIQTQIGTYSACIQPVYHSTDRCPHSLFLYKHSLALPLYHGLTEGDIKTVVNKLKEHIYHQVKRKQDAFIAE